MNAASKLTEIEPYLITGTVISAEAPSGLFTTVAMSVEGQKAPVTLALYNTANVQEGDKLTTVARAAMGSTNRIVAYPTIDGNSPATDKQALLTRAQSFAFNPAK